MAHAVDAERLKGVKAIADIIDADTGEIILEAGKKLAVRAARQLAEKGVKAIKVAADELYGQYLAQDLFDPTTGEIFAEAGDEITIKTLPLLIEKGFDELPILDIDHINMVTSAIRWRWTEPARGSPVRHLSRDASRRAADGRDGRGDVPLFVF